MMPSVKSLIRPGMFAYEGVMMRALEPFARTHPRRLGRTLLARKYLRGSGIEVGAFASPTFIPKGAYVQYVDRVPKVHWSDFPDYRNETIVDVDIVTDAEDLNGIGDESQDFIVAFHVLEHVPGTLRTLETWLNKIRPGGCLLMAVPDKRFTRDALRATTPMEHFVRDYLEGPDWGAEEHYRDLAINVEKLTDKRKIEEYVERREPVAPHYHVWDLQTFIAFLDVARKTFDERFEILEFGLNHEEDICALRIIDRKG